MIYGRKILQVYTIHKVPTLLSDRINPNLMPARTEGKGKHGYAVNCYFKGRKLSERLSLVGHVFLLQMETLMLPAKPWLLS